MRTKLIYGCVVTLLCVMCANVAWSQATRVRGKITSGKQAVPNVQVVLTSPSTGKSYKMKTDRDGVFFAIGVAFGQYNMEVLGPSGEKFFEKTVAVTGAGGEEEDLSTDIGTGGPKVSKEEIERIKAENAKATSINVLIKQYTDAIAAKDLAEKNFQTASASLQGKQDPESAEQLKKLTETRDADVQKAWTAAETATQQMTAADATHWEYFQALGGVETSLKKYQEAVDAYEKGIQVAQGILSGSGPKPSGATDPNKVKAGVAQMLTNEGNDLLKLGKQKEAVAAFTRAAEMSPEPGTAYFNLCATQYNSGNTEGAMAACDKAIAADPNRAETYFIKGSLMMGASTMDKSNKLQAPSGTAEALNKYLELAPNGSHAGDVKEMLAAIGATVKTTYSEKKKK